MSSTATDEETELDKVLRSADVVFFDRESCPFCRKAEEAMRADGIAFKKVPIGDYKDALQERTSKTSAPSVWIKGRYIGGCNDGPVPWQGVLPLLENGGFQRMLSHPDPSEMKVEEITGVLGSWQEVVLTEQEKLDKVINSGDVVFFDRESCPFCRKAEKALQDKGITFRKFPIGDYVDALKERTSKTSAPSVWVKRAYVGGCNDGPEPWQGVLPLLANGGFERMLSHPEPSEMTPDEITGATA